MHQHGSTQGRRSVPPGRTLLLCCLSLSLTLSSAVLAVRAETPSGVLSGAESRSEVLKQARLLETAQQYVEASVRYRAWLTTHPDDDEMRGLLARVLSWQGTYDEASALYEDILSRHPVDLDVRTALARVKAWHKQYAEAQQLYSRILDEHAQHLEARRGLADTLLWSGELRLALEQYEQLSSVSDDPDVTRKIQSIKAELAQQATARDPVTAARWAHDSPAEAELKLPYRNYLKLGYSRFAYTQGIPDAQDGLVEVARALGSRTAVGRLEVLERFGLRDMALSGELYSPLWSQAWGYLSAAAGINPDVVAQVSLGGEVSQGLGVLSPGLAFLEVSLGYKWLHFRDTTVHLLSPGLTIYLPYNLWLTERVSYTPATGAATLSSQLTWRPSQRLQLFVAGSFGTFGERVTASQDFRRIATRVFRAGLTFPLTAWLSAEMSGYYEERKMLHMLRGGTATLLLHW